MRRRLEPKLTHAERTQTNREWEIGRRRRERRSGIVGPGRLVRACARHISCPLCACVGSAAEHGSPLGASQRGTDREVQPGPPVHWGKCVGPSASGVRSPQWRGPSLQDRVEYQKEMRHSLFWARPPDVLFIKEEGLCELSFFCGCAHWLVFVVPGILDMPSVLFSLRRERERYQALLLLFN